MRYVTVCVCAIGLGAAAAGADTIDLFIFENADGIDVSGLDLTVDVNDAGGGQAEFVFNNDSSADSFIAAIYVEDTEFSQGALAGMSLGDVVGDVDFDDGAHPEDPPGSITGHGGSWGGSLYSADHMSGMGNKWAIQPGESQTVDVDLGSATFDDVIDALADPVQFRFAAHIQGVGPDALSSVWATNDPTMQVVPLPPAGLAGLGLLAALGGVRIARRR